MAQRLRVCVLQNSNESGADYAELDPYATPEAYDKAGKYEWSSAFIHKNTAIRQVRELVQSGSYDVFLNLCDGSLEEDRAGIEVVQTLERLSAGFTGATSVFYEPSKATMKKLAHYYEVPTPPWALLMSVDMQDDVRAHEQCAGAVSGLRFPLIVKHYSGGGSVGMGRDCKVTDLHSLMQQVRKFVSSYGGALVEEFIPGREFTVLVVENADDPDQPLTLAPVECKFGPGEEFKHFDLKWVDYESMTWVPLNEQAEPQLARDLRTHAARAFVALRGASYGRADFRVDAQGNVYFLEHNPNCGVFYPVGAHGSADYILTLDPQVDHARLIDTLVGMALSRRAAASCAGTTRVQYRHPTGFGLFAARDLAPGEVIVRYEERPHVLVSAHHVRRVFGAHALPTPPTPAPHPAPALTGHNGSSGLGGGASSGGSSDTELDPSSLACPEGMGPGVHSSAVATHASLGGCMDVSSGSEVSDGEDVRREHEAAHGCGVDVVMSSGEGGAHGITRPSNVTPAAPPLGAVPSTAPTTTTTTGSDDCGAAPLPYRSGLGSVAWWQAYACPITDETWVTWSDDPDEWLPLNHSCDPNAWLTGLDLVARRPIAAGEQISAEYATFTAHNLAPFACCCGARGCRGRVTGQDYLAPWVDQVYGGHLSDYVATKRKQAAGVLPSAPPANHTPHAAMLA